ncbi:hypothetical protein JOE30_002461 [Rhodococcus sp. PvP016]|uniref:HTH iclR-type domain-containing protein n=1 Tax=Rhodococcoides corynebacterioides TaxID=53972 RepID=A0ABS2KR26_9NOCA|nr:hypothetical protein [Rhodococcus corynebacterioides]MBP1116664.1 hypothetical protein [Rhodococcus sp. PvP016]
MQGLVGSDGPPQNDADVIETCTRVIMDHLPRSWTVSVQPRSEAEFHGAREVDADIVLSAPNGQRVILEVEVKTGDFRAADAQRIASRFDQLSGHTADTAPQGRNRNSRSSVVPTLFTKYLTRPTQERLAEFGLSYVDATGNLRLKSDNPVMYLSDRGADSDPWRIRSGRPHLALRGEPAAKIVRTLADFRGPWKTRGLIEAAGVSTGAAYRVLEYLESQELLERRGSRGPINVPNWETLLRLWSHDYHLMETNRITRWIAPRGHEDLLNRMSQSSILDYAVTGSLAASVWAPYAPTKSVMIYTSTPAHAAHEWGLRASDRGNNVLLVQPAYAVALDRTVPGPAGLRTAAPAQVVVDLMTGPGRAPSEAEELLNWMGQHEHTWRRLQ